MSSSSAIEERGLALIVQVRRGGKSREDAIRTFESATQEDGQSVVSWWMEQIVAEYQGGALDKDELEQLARQGFVKGLDTFVYEPGTRSISRKLSIWVMRSIRSEIITEIRKATTKTRRLETNSTQDDVALVIPCDEVSADFVLQASIIEQHLSEEDAEAFRHLLGGDEQIEPDALARIQAIAAEVLGRVL